MSFVIPDDIMYSTRLTNEEMAQEIAVMLYKLGKLSIGKASQFAQMQRIEFQQLLASRQIPINYDANDLQNDIDNLKHFNLNACS